MHVNIFLNFLSGSQHKNKTTNNVNSSSSANIQNSSCFVLEKTREKTRQNSSIEIIKTANFVEEQLERKMKINVPRPDHFVGAAAKSGASGSRKNANKRLGIYASEDVEDGFTDAIAFKMTSPANIYIKTTAQIANNIAENIGIVKDVIMTRNIELEDAHNEEARVTRNRIQEENSTEMNVHQANKLPATVIDQVWVTTASADIQNFTTRKSNYQNYTAENIGAYTKLDNQFIATNRATDIINQNITPHDQNITTDSQIPSVKTTSSTMFSTTQYREDNKNAPLKQLNINQSYSIKTHKNNETSPVAIAKTNEEILIKIPEKNLTFLTNIRTPSIKTTINNHTPPIKTSIKTHTSPIKTTKNNHTLLIKSPINNHTPPIKTTINNHIPPIKTSINNHNPPIKTPINNHTPPIKTSKNNHTLLITTSINNHTLPTKSSKNSHTPSIKSSKNSRPKTTSAALRRSEQKAIFFHRRHKFCYSLAGFICASDIAGEWRDW